MKKILSLLFIFNLFFITPILFVNNLSKSYVAHAQENGGGEGEGGDGSGEGDGAGNDLSGFDDQFVNMPDAGLGVVDEGFLANLANAVSNVVFTITNAVATVTDALGLTTLTDIITGFGYSFGSNVASEEGLTAVGAGTLVSAVTGGVGGFVAGQAVTGAMQGTLGGDIAGIMGSVTGGTDGPKSGTVNPPNGQTPPYIPNLPISKNLSVTDVANLSTTDYCPQSPVNYSITSNETFNKFKTQDYKPNWGDNDVFILKINVRSTDTTKGGQPIGFQFSDSLASRAFVRAVISKSKCDFGPDATWVGRPVGWQPSAQDIARYTYADGTKPTKFLGDNSASAEFTINDQRSGLLNLTTGTWYVTFQYLDNCSDKNTSNPNRNTTCHKVVSWQGAVQSMTPTDVSDIIKTNNSNAVINTVSNIKTNNNSGYNDLGVPIPKSLSVEDIINPSIIDTIKAWVGLPVSTSPIIDGVKSGTVSNNNILVTNLCPSGQSYPDSRFGEYHDKPSRQMYKNTDPTRTYTIEMSIKDNTTAGKIMAQLPKITYELPAGVSNDWNATISRNPCDFSSSAQVVMNSESSGWKYFTVDDARTNPGVLNLAPGKWYISFKQARKCLTPGIPSDSPNQNDCGIFFELPGYTFQEYIGESSGNPNNSSPSMMVTNAGSASALGASAANAVLNDVFLKNDNLNWGSLCSNAISKPLITTNPFKSDYSRQFKAGIEVYPFDVPNSTTYEGSFYAVGLSSSSNNPIYAFVSDKQCAGTSNNVYSFGGGISGANATLSSTNYSGSQPGAVKLKPGRWYVTLLWGSGAVPAPTSPNYQTYLTDPTPVYVRFSSRLFADASSVTPPTSPGSGFTSRTINNSSCSINLTGPQYGLVNTTLVYKKFLPNANGSYWMGSMFTYTPEALAATLPDCPTNITDGMQSVPAIQGNRGTYRNINAECKVKGTTDIYSLDYPQGCYTLCSSSQGHPSAFIDVRGDCVLNGTASF